MFPAITKAFKVSALVIAGDKSIPLTAPSEEEADRTIS
jgi:hypothetical protein